MRTNIEIPDEIITEAMKITGITTKKEMVHYALKECVKLHKRRSTADLRGKLQWEGSLDEMRQTG